MLFTVGCQANNVEVNPEVAAEKNEGITEEETYNLELLNIKMRDRSGLTYVMGEIKNNSDISVDKIGDMVLLDDDGNVVRVKKIHLEIAPGESTYFEELVGQTEELTVRPTQIILDGF